MYGCTTRVTFSLLIIDSLHWQHQVVSFTELCVYGCTTRVTFFSPHHRLTSLPTSGGEFYWIVYVWMHGQSNFFLSSSSTHFIANIRRWVLLNCVCMDAWPEYITFFSSHYRLTSLTTSVGEFYWIVYVWMHDQSNFFSPHHRLTSLTTSGGEFYWIVYVWMHDQSNFFLSSSSTHFIDNIRRWVLLNCVCMDARPE